MGNVLVQETSLKDIANAIREKNGTEETYKPAEMGSAVRAIESGGGDFDFVGIKYSDFDEHRGSPKVADATSMPPITLETFTVNGGYPFMFSLDNYSTTLNKGWHAMLTDIYLADGYERISPSMFNGAISLERIHADLTNVKIIGDMAFKWCKSLTELPYMPILERLENSCFSICTGLTEVKIHSTSVTYIATTVFASCTNITDIYVPWAEGEVENAPWGATNATIHYNTVYDENHEPIV
jgi:hypothetical protein